MPKARPRFYLATTTLLVAAAAASWWFIARESDSGDRVSEASTPDASCGDIEDSAVDVPADVHLEVDNDVVRPGDMLTLRLTARNESPTHLAYATTGQRYELWVEGVDGQVVWKWSERPDSDQMTAFTDEIEGRRLATGEMIEVSESWDGRVGCGDNPIAAPGGRYLARGAWIRVDADTGERHLWMAPAVEIRIVT